MNNRIKITFCMYRIITGGIENSLLRVLEELVKKDIFIITVVSKDPNILDKYRKFFFKNNIKVKICPSKSNFQSSNFFINKLNGFIVNYKIKKIFKNSKLIIDYFNGSFSEEISSIDVPKIAFMHLSSMRMSRAFYERLNSTFDYIVALTDKFVEHYLFYYPSNYNKIVKILNPINIDVIKKHANLPPYSPEDRKYFTFIGRLDPDKDHDTVFRAFDIFLKNNPDGLVFFIGDGPLREEYEDRIIKCNLQNNIILCGNLDNPFGYLKNAKANILSSKNEGLPVVLIEAACLNTLNISSDCPDGPPEILESGNNGVLFPVGDYETLAKILDEVWNDKDCSRQQLIKNASNSLYKYDQAYVVNQMTELFFNSIHNYKKNKKASLNTIDTRKDVYFDDLKKFTNHIVQRKLSTMLLHRDVFPKFKNIHNGKDIVIVACGPSERKYISTLENCIYIGVSNAFLYDRYKYNYIFIQDFSNTISDNESRICEMDCIKFFGLKGEVAAPYRTIPEDFAIKARAYRYRTDWENISSFDTEFAYDLSVQALGDGGSIVLTALQFALWTNPKRIFIVGADSAKTIKYDGAYLNGDVDVDVLSNFWKFKRFAKQYYPNVEIFSINPIDLKGVFRDIFTE